MQSSFSREDTKLVKGIGILLMLAHHLWAFPARNYGLPSETITVFGEPLFVYIGIFGKICVPLFFFLGGYGMVKTNQTGNLCILRKLKGLYCAYWKVFLIFIPIGFLFFSNQPMYFQDAQFCERFDVLMSAEFLSNFLGISCTYNLEWWFFRAYVIAILTFPLVDKLLDGVPTAYGIAGIILMTILEHNVFPALGTLECLGSLNTNYLYASFFTQTTPYVGCFWMGILMAKENLLDSVKNAMKNCGLLHPIVDVGGILCILFLHNSAAGESLDLVYVPAFLLFFLDLVKRSRILCAVFAKLGAQSTNMWLIHSFFCYYFFLFVRITVFSRNHILSLITLTVMSYIASILTDTVWNLLLGVVRKWKIKEAPMKST